jgi:ribose 5-phosphate isomerase A
MTASSDRDVMKRAAALKAVEQVEDGMVLGLGSGSTAAFAVEAVAARIANGLRVLGIPTSERTAVQARRLGVPLSSFDEHRRVDLTIDGADEVERGTLHLIKGLGGALLHEKIVAAASDRLVIVVDGSKLVDRLGAKTPVPVEVVVFGWQATSEAIEALGAKPTLRTGDANAPFVTDEGNYILDCGFGPIVSPERLEKELASIAGVVESGLFINRASEVIAATEQGIEILRPAAARSSASRADIIAPLPS